MASKLFLLQVDWKYSLLFAVIFWVVLMVLLWKSIEKGSINLRFKRNKQFLADIFSELRMMCKDSNKLKKACYENLQKAIRIARACLRLSNF